MKLDHQTFRVTDAGRVGSVALGAGVIGLLVSAVGYFTDPAQFSHSYLVAFIFWLSFGLGGLFFTMLHHLVDAEWSTVLRRIGEGAMATLPAMGLFLIPVLFGMHELYHWSHADVVAHDEILQGKSAFLNPTFFVIRSIGYFVIWGILSTLLFRTSIQQDLGGSTAITQRLRKISAPGMILFAITISFAAFDWMMSIDAHWYSTIYGLYWFAGSFLSILCFMVLFGIYQRQRSILHDKITVEHYHDLGKWLLGFIVFWAYMGFSQYMLIWYANIPEETVWYTHRWHGSWSTMSLTLVFGHFALPFLAMLTRAAKRNLLVLGVTSAWLLIMRWVDIYWLVFPGLHPEGPQISWMDFSTLIGIGGICVWMFWQKYTSHPVLPVGDQSLQNSIQFENR